MAEDLAPSFVIESSNIQIGDDLHSAITNVEVESADGVAEIIELSIDNANLNKMNLVDAKVFQPGNELNIWIGYKDFVHNGRFMIAKTTPDFPAGGVPTLKVVGYSLDFAMMDNAPEGSLAKKKDGTPTKRKRKVGGRVFADVRHSDVVIEKATEYGMEVDVDETPLSSRNLIQKVGLSDYEFVKGLANLNGFVFWVDGDFEGKWTLHFKDPTTLVAQEKHYNFEYSRGDQGSLLSFEPVLALRNSKTKLKVLTKNAKTGVIMEEEIEESALSPELLYEGADEDEATEGHTTGAAVKLFFDDFAIDIIANRKFETTAELKHWASQWFRKHRENFVMARGMLIGIENLKARQVHTISGVGNTLSGEYYFSRVRHILGKDGYKTEFNARKIVKG